MLSMAAALRSGKENAELQLFKGEKKQEEEKLNLVIQKKRSISI